MVKYQILKRSEFWKYLNGYMDNEALITLPKVPLALALVKHNEKMFDIIEAVLVMPWEGTVTETDLTAKQMHEKILDYNRERFNNLKNKYVHGNGLKGENNG